MAKSPQRWQKQRCCYNKGCRKQEVVFFIMPVSFSAGKIQEKELATEKAVTEAVHR